MSEPQNTTPPGAPTTIKRLPIEYDQQINSMFNDMLFNASQAKAMCFVTDTMGHITQDAKTTMLVLRDAIFGGTEGSIVQDFIDVESNYGVVENNVLEIYRPYYERYKQIGMLRVVEKFNLQPLVDLGTDAEAEDIVWQTTWNDLIEAIGNNQRGF